GLAANLRGGKLAVTVGESEAFGGEIKGSFEVAKSEAGVDLKSQMLFSEVDLESSLGDLFGVHHLEGKGNFSFDVTGAGGSIMAMMRRLNGVVILAARDGALVGYNVEQLLHQLDRRPLSGIGDLRGGRTPFEKLDVSIKIADGTATLADFKIQGPTVRLALG